MKALKNFASEEFRRDYHYDKPLGAFCGPEGTKICLWAPTADAVFLHFYSKGDGSAVLETVPMEKGKQGVWFYKTTLNLDGRYYDFDVTVDGVTRRTADPYAKACGVNGKRSMVIDLKKTNPEGWEQDQAPAATPEQAIPEFPTLR